MTNPIQLDLSSENDERYAVLVNALSDYATTLEHQADDADESDVDNHREPGGPAAAGFRQHAATARQLIEDIEHQLDAGSTTTEAGRA